MGKHLTYEKRLTIDRMLNKGHSIKEIVPKILQCDAYAAEIGRLILEERYSPEAAMYAVNRNGIDYGVRITSVATIYKAIRHGHIKGVTMKDCPLHGRKKVKKQRVDRTYKRPRGVSIEERNKEILDRLEFGHWEMDSVLGKQTSRSKECLLVLTERKTRYEIIEPLKDHGADEVVRALRRIKKSAQANLGSSSGILFKSITCDNGLEFSRVDDMSKIAPIYFAHPRSPFERGTNENNNKLLRRFYPKGTDLNIPVRKIKRVERWMNHYPRRQFGGMSAQELFDREIAGI